MKKMKKKNQISKYFPKCYWKVKPIFLIKIILYSPYTSDHTINPYCSWQIKPILQIIKRFNGNESHYVVRSSCYCSRHTPRFHWKYFAEHCKWNLKVLKMNTNIIAKKWREMHAKTWMHSLPKVLTLWRIASCKIPPMEYMNLTTVLVCFC